MDRRADLSPGFASNIALPVRFLPKARWISSIFEKTLHFTKKSPADFQQFCQAAYCFHAHSRFDRQIKNFFGSTLLRLFKRNLRGRHGGVELRKIDNRRSRAG